MWAFKVVFRSEELSHALHYLECVKSHTSSLISEECQFNPARYSEQRQLVFYFIPHESALSWSLEFEAAEDKEVLRILCRKVEAEEGN